MDAKIASMGLSAEHANRVRPLALNLHSGGNINSANSIFDRLHKAMGSIMAKHQPDILLPIVLDVKEPITPATLPIIAKTVDTLPVCAPAHPPASRPLVYPPREPLSTLTPRESLPTSSSESTPPVREETSGYCSLPAQGDKTGKCANLSIL